MSLCLVCVGWVCASMYQTVCMGVYVCVCMQIYMHMCVYVHVCIDMCMHVWFVPVLNMHVQCVSLAVFITVVPSASDKTSSIPESSAGFVDTITPLSNGSISSSPASAWRKLYINTYISHHISINKFLKHKTLKMVAGNPYYLLHYCMF